MKMSRTISGKPLPTSQDNLTGYISGFPVSSLIQAIELEQKTCTMQVRKNGNEGCIYIKNGVVLNAQTDTLSGENAAIRILGWENPKIKLTKACKTSKRDIHSSLTRLILDASRLKDESNYASRAPNRLIEAIHLLEGHHFKAAYTLICAYLKTNPKSDMAWFWRSRCLGKLNAISNALVKCSQLTPNSKLIAEEIQKIEHAHKHVKDGQIRRCPFCWSPMEAKAHQCFYCNSKLTIAGALRENTREKVKSKFLIDAVTRYTDVIAREGSMTAAYYLSLANCNLNKAEEALDLLTEAARANPDNQFLSKQLNSVVNHVATRLTKYEDIASLKTKKLKRVQPADQKDNKKILVVEDSPTTRKVIGLTLKQKGYALVEAQDGLEALSLMNEERPDLILLDIILPKMDGYRILSIIKKTQDLKDTPVILLTSKDGLINKAKGRLAGATAYLTKPFEPKELIGTVRKYLP